MAGPGRLLLLLLAVPPLQASLLPEPGTPEGKATIAHLILSAGERAAAFLEERLPEINLDGMVGFRVLEAQLQGVQKAWAHDPRLQLLSLRTSKLAEKLAALLQRSLFHLRQSDPKYLREFRLIIEPGFWKPPRVWTHTNASLVYPTFEPEDSFSEEHSDLCLVQLLGTGAESSQPCRLSDFCRTLMTTDGCSGYCLSHQLLFFLSARMVSRVSGIIQYLSFFLAYFAQHNAFKKGCTSGLFQHSQRYMDLFCANMMDLNRRAEAIGYAYPTQDIFMENIMLCGISGFSDFYKLRWLQAILSWQKPWKGCFGQPAAENEGPKAAEYQGHFLRRVKRREKTFTDGCSSHNTAMAVGALGGFLYVLAEQPSTNGKPLQSTPSPPSSY